MRIINIEILKKLNIKKYDGGEYMNIDVQTLLIEMAKAKMSIKELSEKSEVCRGTIAAIKKGSEVKPETVGKIAEALGVSVEELLED